LLHQTKCKAAYVDSDITYLASISGVSGKRGQEALLRWLVCLINSPLTRYYQFLTSTRWAVERANPLHKEYLDMPFLIPDGEDPKFRRVLYHFEQVVDISSKEETEETFFDSKRERKLQEHEAAINELIFELYDLHPVEQELVEDILEYGIGFFNWSKQKNRRPRGAKSVQGPQVPMLEAYAEIFTRTATSLLRVRNQTLNAIVYENGAPLTVVVFDLVRLEERQPIRVLKEPEAMRTKLHELDELLLSRKVPSMYMRRHVRIYDGNQLSLVRPNERRFWTRSQARTDADAFLAELSS
jgi:hypothetical protein